jgi:hypothetical protein
MDMTTVSQLISSVGFPIAACCGMFWYMNKEREEHAAEVKNLTETINNNTLALTQLKDVLTNKTEARS